MEGGRAKFYLSGCCRLHSIICSVTCKYKTIKLERQACAWNVDVLGHHRCRHTECFLMATMIAAAQQEQEVKKRKSKEGTQCFSPWSLELTRNQLMFGEHQLFGG